MADDEEKTGWAKYGMPDRARRFMATVRDGVAALLEAVSERLEACESRLYETQEEIDARTDLQKEARTIARRIGMFSDGSISLLQGRLQYFSRYFNRLRGQFGEPGEEAEDAPVLYDCGHDVAWSEDAIDYGKSDNSSDSGGVHYWNDYASPDLLEHADGGFTNWLTYSEDEIDDETESESNGVESEAGEGEEEATTQTLLARLLAPYPAAEWFQQKYDALNKMTTRVTNGMDFYWKSASGDQEVETTSVAGTTGRTTYSVSRYRNVRLAYEEGSNPGWYRVLSSEDGAPRWGTPSSSSHGYSTGWSDAEDGRSSAFVFVTMREVFHDNRYGEWADDYPIDEVFPRVMRSSCRWKLVYPRNRYRKAGVKIKARIQVCAFSDVVSRRATYGDTTYVWVQSNDTLSDALASPTILLFDSLGTSYSNGDIIVAEGVSPGASPKAQDENGAFTENEEEVVLFEMEDFEADSLPSGFTSEYEDTDGVLCFGFCLRVLSIEEDWSDVFEFKSDSEESESSEAS